MNRRLVVAGALVLVGVAAGACSSLPESQRVATPGPRGEPPDYVRVATDEFRKQHPDWLVDWNETTNLRLLTGKGIPIEGAAWDDSISPRQRDGVARQLLMDRLDLLGARGLEPRLVSAAPAGNVIFFRYDWFTDGGGGGLRQRRCVQGALYNPGCPVHRGQQGGGAADVGPVVDPADRGTADVRPDHDHCGDGCGVGRRIPFQGLQTGRAGPVGDQHVSARAQLDVEPG